MKNPFIQAAALMALMTAAFRENAYRDFYGKDFKGHSGSGTKHRSQPFCSAGGKLFKKASKGRLGMRHPCRLGAPSI